MDLKSPMRVLKNNPVFDWQLELMKKRGPIGLRGPSYYFA